MADRSGVGRALKSAATPVRGNGRNPTKQIDRIREALGVGDWTAARAICTALVESDPPPPGIVLEQLAISEFMLGSFDRVGVAAERAYAAYIEEGDELAAIRVATHLVGLRELLGDWPAARGWERRGW
ncbi:MAG TPA: hypothetical protein VIO85_12055, partial [Candidatus Dormibacteraeota bacterium]